MSIMKEVCTFLVPLIIYLSKSVCINMPHFSLYFIFYTAGSY